MKKIRATELGALKDDSAITFAQQTAHGSTKSAIYNHHHGFFFLMEKNLIDLRLSKIIIGKLYPIFDKFRNVKIKSSN